jgi:hypothetical protein
VPSLPQIGEHGSRSPRAGGAETRRSPSVSDSPGLRPRDRGPPIPPLANRTFARPLQLRLRANRHPEETFRLRGDETAPPLAQQNRFNRGRGIHASRFGPRGVNRSGSVARLSWSGSVLRVGGARRSEQVRDPLCAGRLPPTDPEWCRPVGSGEGIIDSGCHGALHPEGGVVRAPMRRG